MTEQKQTTWTIVMIPVDQIAPHPDNPRRDLGDLTELSDDIAKNGVLQNLTLVPSHLVSEKIAEPYTAVISHRRHAAAKRAGLDAVPAAIREMDHKQQIAAMLVENIQRNDLTVMEQAKGFK